MRLLSTPLKQNVGSGIKAARKGDANFAGLDQRFNVILIAKALRDQDGSHTTR